jgi:hypothetical protein
MPGVTTVGNSNMTPSSTTTSTEMRLRFNMPAFDPESFLELAMGALIQNCISGVRHGFMLGFVPAPMFLEQKSKQLSERPAATFTVDVYSDFAGLTTDQAKHAYTQHLTAQAQKLWQQTICNPLRRCELSSDGAGDPNPKLGSMPRKPIAFDSYRWERLMHDFARNRGIPHPHHFSKLSIFNVNGSDAQLFYTESRPDRFELRVDVGAVPQGVPEPLVYQTLLMHNALEGFETDLWWAMNPKNNHLVLVMDQPLSTTESFFTPISEAELAEVIEGVVAQAAQMWRDLQTQLLDVESIQLSEIQAN